MPTHVDDAPGGSVPAFGTVQLPDTDVTPEPEGGAATYPAQLPLMFGTDVDAAFEGDVDIAENSPTTVAPAEMETRIRRSSFRPVNVPPFHERCPGGRQPSVPPTTVDDIDTQQTRNIEPPVRKVQVERVERCDRANNQM